MLYGIPAQLPAELLGVLAAMGHGDELALVDANFPAASIARQTGHGRLIELMGRNAPEAVADILALMPLDAFDEHPVKAMAVPGATDAPPVHQAISAVLAATPGAPWKLQPTDRFEFYEQATDAFVVVRTLERRPYGCFLFKKGVLTPEGELMTPEYANRV